MSGPGPRVAVLYNAPVLPADHPDAASEADVVHVANRIVSELKGRGFVAYSWSVGSPILLSMQLLDGSRADVVFNLTEGFGGRAGGEVYITGILELLGLPYTGCPPEAQALCLRKGMAQALLRGFGLPTAPFVVLEPGDAIPEEDYWFPAFVKPEGEDGSLGIDQGSVATTPAALAARVEHVRSRYGPRVLVETYLPGPEYNVGVIALPEPVPLPVAEVVYDVPPGGWPILTYAAKWHEGSAEDRRSPVRCPAEIDPALADRLGQLAVAAFRATGCRDLARVDFRLDDRGEPMILEVNPNPDLGPTAGLARALRASGREYGDVVAAMARQALMRGARPR